MFERRPVAGTPRTPWFGELRFFLNTHMGGVPDGYRSVAAGPCRRRIVSLARPRVAVTS